MRHLILLLIILITGLANLYGTAPVHGQAYYAETSQNTWIKRLALGLYVSDGHLGSTLRYGALQAIVAGYDRKGSSSKKWREKFTVRYNHPLIYTDTLDFRLFITGGMEKPPSHILSFTDQRILQRMVPITETGYMAEFYILKNQKKLSLSFEIGAKLYLINIKLSGEDTVIDIKKTLFAGFGLHYYF